MKRIIAILTLALSFAFVSEVEAQVQTTAVGASHTYKVNTAPAYDHTGSTYVWSVENGTVGEHYNVISGAGTHLWEIQWLKESPAEFYTVQVTEAIDGCPTKRQFTVKVGNSFDAMVASAQTDDVCTDASANGLVIADVGDDTDNSNDDFGTTVVRFKVALTAATTAVWTPAWDFDFLVSSTTADITAVVAEGAGFSDLNYVPGTKLGNIDIAENTTEIILAVTVKTIAASAQDIDLTISNVTEKTSNQNYTDVDDGNDKLGIDNEITIKPMPATTGITFE